MVSNSWKLVELSDPGHFQVPVQVLWSSIVKQPTGDCKTGFSDVNRQWALGRWLIRDYDRMIRNYCNRRLGVHHARYARLRCRDYSMKCGCRKDENNAR
jgi:hypothetical protein